MRVRDIRSKLEGKDNVDLEGDRWCYKNISAPTYAFESVSSQTHQQNDYQPNHGSDTGLILSNIQQYL